MKIDIHEVGTHTVEGRDTAGFLQISMRYDGCIHLWTKDEVDKGEEVWTDEGKLKDSVYQHICEPIEFFEELIRFCNAAIIKLKENGTWCG